MLESVKSLRTLKPYFWRYRWEFLFGGVCVLMLNGIWALFPQVLKLAVDRIDDTVRVRQLLAWAPLCRPGPCLRAKFCQRCAAGPDRQMRG